MSLTMFRRQTMREFLLDGMQYLGTLAFVRSERLREKARAPS